MLIVFAAAAVTALATGLAGAMIWMVRRELPPSTFRQIPRRRGAAAWISAACAAMFGFQTYVLA